MSETVPQDWLECELNNFVVVGRGYAFKSSDYVSAGYPIVRVTNISDTNGLDLSNDVVYLANGRAKEFKPYQLKDDDFLLVMVGATVGKYAKVNTQGNKLFLNQNMWCLSVVDDQTNSQKFAIYGLQRVVEEFLRTMQGSAREFLTQKEFGKASILVPPLPEQEKIASILTSVDEVIENTQQQIDKLQDLKKAMMNELLTKGIGHKEFKDSELGRIPKSWEIKRIGDVASLIMGQSPPSNTYNQNKNGLPFFQGKADFGPKFPTIRYWCTSPIKIAPPVSILFSVRAPVGYVNLNNVKACIGRGLASILGTSINSTFLYHTLINAKEKLEALGQGSTFEAINNKELNEFPLACPQQQEQNKIAEILNSIDTQIEEKQEKLNKNKLLKKPLMQDLLTGKVRVKVN